MSWSDTISATHGVFFTSQDQVKAWEEILKKAIPDLKEGEIRSALYEAMNRDEKTEGYRLTVKDVIKWVRQSRRSWKERTEKKGGWEYFPDRPHICGQIQRRRIK